MPTDPKELPPEDQPDYDLDALTRKLGYVHVSEALQQRGELELLKDQTFAEVQRDLLAHVDDLVGKSREEIEGIVFRIVRGHIENCEDRLSAIERAYGMHED